MASEIERLTDVHLDPFASPALHQELPGLRAAFDEPAMRGYLQRALFGDAAARYTVDRCELDQATYVGGVCAILRYLLAVGDSEGAGGFEALVSGRVFPNQALCDAYVADRLWPAASRMNGREEIAAFARPAAVIEPLHMAIHVFPIDGDLPELQGATDRARLRAVFARTLPAAQARVFEVEDCRVELVDYGRERRATLRYHVSGLARRGGAFEQVVYGKVTGDGSGAMAPSISAALREQLLLRPAERRFAVPDVFYWLPDIQLALLEAIPGQAVIADMVKGRLRGKPEPEDLPPLETLLETCGRIAATLHTSRIALGPRRTLDDELAALRRAFTHIQRVSPELGAEVGRRLDALAVAAARSQPLPACFNHGDFTHGQVLTDGAASGLIDFDSVCQAEPALDLGQFLTYLRLAGLKSKLTPAATDAALDELGERFLRAYLDAAGAAAGDPARLRERVSLYRSASLLRRIARSWQKFKPGRIEGAISLLDKLDA
jgi:aminoglycoside phosphotransferase (APT) family kinase protein